MSIFSRIEREKSADLKLWCYSENCSSFIKYLHECIVLYFKYFVVSELLVVDNIVLSQCDSCCQGKGSFEKQCVACQTVISEHTK